MKEKTLSTDQMIYLIEDLLSLGQNSTWTTLAKDGDIPFRFRFMGCRYTVLVAIFQWIERRILKSSKDRVAEGSQELKSKVKFVKCYHPYINKTHLTDFILVPEDRVYEYTKYMHEDIIKSNPLQ